MTPDQLQELARQISADAFLSSWKFWVTQLALLLVAAFGGAWLSSYASTRGKQQATKADLEEILSQLKKTTGVAESVKSAISHTDWTRRERTQLLRTKLEQLALRAYEISDWLDDGIFKINLADEREILPSPIPLFDVLQRLYFPGLSKTASGFSMAASKCFVAILKARGEYLDTRSRCGADDPKALSVATMARDAVLKNDYLPMRNALETLLAEVESSMSALIDISDGLNADP